MTAYLFSPPWRRDVHVLRGRGGLRYGQPVCWKVYKLNGVWTASETTSNDTLAAATWPLPDSICDRPQVVPDAMGTELLAALASINAQLPTGINPATILAIT